MKHANQILNSRHKIVIIKKMIKKDHYRNKEKNTKFSLRQKQKNYLMTKETKNRVPEKSERNKYEDYK